MTGLKWLRPNLTEEVNHRGIPELGEHNSRGSEEKPEHAQSAGMGEALRTSSAKVNGCRGGLGRGCLGFCAPGYVNLVRRDVTRVYCNCDIFLIVS